MDKYFFQSSGASVIGPSHLTHGFKNQDFYIARSFKWGHVGAVSDGLGSKKFSDIGAKAACKAVMRAASFYVKQPEYKHCNLLKLIHHNWLDLLSPLDIHDCLATCLFYIIFQNKIILGQIGDGMVVFLSDNSKKSFVLKKNQDNAFSNITTSLTNEFNGQAWTTQETTIENCKMLLLCTDGISDDLIEGQEFAFAESIYRNYLSLPTSKRRKDMLKWLKNWSVPLHSDDKTVLCAIKKMDYSYE